jgi:hypothetical protein
LRKRWAGTVGLSAPTQLVIHFSTRRFSYPVTICSIPPIIFFDVKATAIVGEPVLNHWMEGRRPGDCRSQHVICRRSFFHLESAEVEDVSR